MKNKTGTVTPTPSTPQLSHSTSSLTASNSSNGSQNNKESKKEESKKNKQTNKDTSQEAPTKKLKKGDDMNLSNTNCIYLFLNSGASSCREKVIHSRSRSQQSENS